MNAQAIPMSNQMSVVATLAALLERVEQTGTAPDARQYQSLVRRLSQELAGVEGDPLLPALLDAFPAAAQVYENLQYQHAGLCRTELGVATQAELQAQQLLQRAGRFEASKGQA